MACGLCGEVFRKEKELFLEIDASDQSGTAAGPAPQVASPARRERAAVEDKPRDGWRRFVFRPAGSLVLGLLFFPLAKALWIPNYVFNFLATLVHECGHALFAFLMGRFAIPAVHLGGGGITQWTDSAAVACLMVWAGLVYGAWWLRGHKGALAGAVSVCAVYPLLAFTSMNEMVAIAGGVFLEVAAAAACFHAAMWPDLKHPVERPLFALWGWWMLLNRGTETVMMLRDESYWNAQSVYQDGIAAGLTSDLEVIRGHFTVSPYPVLWSVLALCVLCLPAAVASVWVRKRLMAAAGY